MLEFSMPSQPPAISPGVARDWIARWDRQQETYLADREDRFTALIDAVEAAAARRHPVVLDLGSGPGSLGVRLLKRLPQATIFAVDADPVTLRLGRAAYGDLPGLRFVDADLRDPGWVSQIDLAPGQRIDAVVSCTALHWLNPEQLTGLYATLAILLRPGGLLLNADHFRLDETTSPVLAQLDRALEARQNQRRVPSGPAGRGEDWEQWWRAAAHDDTLSGAVAERERRGVGHHGPESVQLAVHSAALREAGFKEIGTLWQRGASRILAAVL